VALALAPAALADTRTFDDLAIESDPLDGYAPELRIDGDGIAPRSR
jgi:hypothetical protein